MHDLATFKYKNIQSKQLRKNGDTVFPIIALWEISVTMETRVLIRFVQKQPFPHPKVASDKAFIPIDLLVSEIFRFKTADAHMQVTKVSANYHNAFSFLCSSCISFMKTIYQFCDLGHVVRLTNVNTSQ